MLITKTQDTMTIRSIEQIKLFMSVLFLSLGLLSLVSPSLFTGVSAWAYLVGIMIILAATLMLSDVTYTRVELHKSGPSKVSIKNLRHRESFEFNISDMKSIIKREYLGMGNGEAEPNDLLIFTFKNREKLGVASTRQNNTTEKIKRPYRREAKKIAEFTGVPLEIKQTDLFKDAENLVETDQ